MPLVSMTGFGAAGAEHDGWVLSVECRSVNHRGLDVRVHGVRELAWLEKAAHQAVRSRLNRGRVEVRLQFERAGSGGSGIDVDRFAQMALSLRNLATEHALPPPTTGDVLRALQTYANAANGPEQDSAFERVIADAIDALAVARRKEGEALAQTMRELIASAHEQVEAIDALAATIADEYRSRLQARMQDTLAKFGVDEIDERALLHEVAIYADRSDVAEEVQRARSHIVRLRELVDDEAAATRGKEIDFYLQELNREANTTGSKSSSTQITDRVVALKSAIEKMREQAANIE